MVDNRLKLLITSIRKLIRRNAIKNIQIIIDKAHAADIAVILKELDSQERSVILSMRFSIEKKSEVISHLDEDLQQEIITQLDKNQVTQIVTEMETDDAADLLGHLSEELSQTILDSMQSEEKREVTDLMKYPDDTAGGLMSSNYLAFPQDIAVADVIQKIQNEDNSDAVAFYIYVIDETGKLTGVVSLKEIILSKPRETLKEIMTAEVISVGVEIDQEAVSKVVERYDFLSVPVVNDSNVLVGVITVDDVIDVIREEAQENFLAMGLVSSSDDETYWGRIKGRSPWLLVTFVGGIICYYFIWSLFYEKMSSIWLSLTAFLPLIIATSATVGIQSATSAVSILISDAFDTKKLQRLLKNEVICAIVFGFVLGSLVFIMSLLMGEELILSGFVAVALFVQLICSVFIGSTIPLMMKRIGLDPTVASVSLFLAASNISAVLITFGSAYKLF